MHVKGSIKDRIKTFFFILLQKKKRKNDLKQNNEKQNNKQIFLKSNIINKEVIIKISKTNKQEINRNISNNIVKKPNILKSKLIKTNTLKASNLSNNTKETLLKSAKLKNIPKKISEEEIKIDEYLKKFILKNNEIVKELSLKVDSLSKKLKNAKTKEEIKKNNDELIKLNEEIEKLKSVYETLLKKYNFKDYDILYNNLLLDQISNFKFQSSEEEIDELVIKCKEKLKYLTSLSKLTYELNENKKININKKDTISKLDNDYNLRTIDFDKLKQAGYIINNLLVTENNYANNLLKEIDKNDIMTKTISHFKFDKDYLNNIIALGISLNPFQKTLVGAFIYGFIINSSISKLMRKSFTREYETKYFIKYTEFVSKIKDNKSLIDTTYYLLLNTIDNLDNLEEYLKQEYKEYIAEPKYKELLNKVMNYKKTLKNKQIELSKTKENINQLEEKNKLKVKKIDEYNKI